MHQINVELRSSYVYNSPIWGKIKELVHYINFMFLSKFLIHLIWLIYMSMKILARTWEEPDNSYFPIEIQEYTQWRRNCL